VYIGFLQLTGRYGCQGVARSAAARAELVIRSWPSKYCLDATHQYFVAAAVVVVVAISHTVSLQAQSRLSLLGGFSSAPEITTREDQPPDGFH
jgi:hypothetical protein